MPARWQRREICWEFYTNKQNVKEIGDAHTNRVPACAALAEGDKPETLGQMVDATLEAIAARGSGEPNLK